MNLDDFVSAIEHPKRKLDTETLIPLIQEASGYTPYIANRAVCFGKYHYVYDSGREGDSTVVGFAPRKAHLVVYVMPGFKPYATLLKKLGKYKTGSSCLYINKLEDIDLDVLIKLIEKSCRDMEKKYDCTNEAIVYE